MPLLLPEKGIGKEYSSHIDKNTTDHLKIRFPKPATIVTPHGKASLVWDMNAEKMWQGKYTRAQKYVDSEVLRLSEPFTPLRIGLLIKSGITGTKVGSGLVQWTVPYAKARYYRVGKIGSETGPQRGWQWFERMKEVHGRSIVTGARRIAGGGNEFSG